MHAYRVLGGLVLITGVMACGGKHTETPATVPVATSHPVSVPVASVVPTATELVIGSRELPYAADQSPTVNDIQWRLVAMEAPATVFSWSTPITSNGRFVLLRVEVLNRSAVIRHIASSDVGLVDGSGMTYSPLLDDIAEAPPVANANLFPNKVFSLAVVFDIPTTSTGLVAVLGEPKSASKFFIALPHT